MDEKTNNLKRAMHEALPFLRQEATMSCECDTSVGISCYGCEARYLVGLFETTLAGEEINQYDENAIRSCFGMLMKDIHNTAVKHGFWEEGRRKAEYIALMHSELSEALEEIRNDCDETEELGDCIIRILDYCEAHKLDIAYYLTKKIAENKNREHKHGKLF